MLQVSVAAEVRAELMAIAARKSVPLSRVVEQLLRGALDRVPVVERSTCAALEARRLRPKLATTLAPEVDAALRERARATGLPIGRVADAAIRIGLGLSPRESLPSPAVEESAGERFA
jgi:hypothetical protein